MRFLLDENIDHQVGAVLQVDHEVRFVVDVLTPGASDAVIRRYARAERCILVTGDRRFAARVRRVREQPLLFLHDLRERERDRVAELLSVVLTEALASGDRFWMEIRPEQFIAWR